jgi:hypothetical protein
MSDSVRAATRPHVLSAENAALRCSHGAVHAPRWPASGPGASMIRAGSGRTRMCGHRARSRGMCLLPIQESFYEDVSEHSAVEAFASAAHQSSHANPDGQCRNRAIPLTPTSKLRSIPDRWVTGYSGDIGNTLAAEGVCRGAAGPNQCDRHPVLEFCPDLTCEPFTFR